MHASGRCSARPNKRREIEPTHGGLARCQGMRTPPLTPVPAPPTLPPPPGPWPDDHDFDAAVEALLALDLFDVGALVYTQRPWARVDPFCGRVERIDAEGRRPRRSAVMLELASRGTIIVERAMFTSAGPVTLPELGSGLVVVQPATVLFVLDAG